MQALRIDPPVPMMIPTGDVFILLCGCGGTGSHIAQSLARLAVHCRDLGMPKVSLAFIDGDTVEHKNVGRQLFSVADVGKNKAQVLAARFSAVFGLDILAYPQMLSATGIPYQAPYGILVGAVDSATGRRAIASQLNTRTWRMWLDCGNHESSGQVVAGNILSPESMTGAIQHGLCSKLPAASLIYPDLLKEQPQRPRADCAAAMEDNAQSLCVNQAIASIASQYLYQIVVKRRLATFRTVVDLESLSMRSDPITARTLASATGVTVEQIEGVKGHKKRRAA